MRERYFDLMANPGRIEDVLQAGAAKARKLAVPMMRELREAVGLRNLNAQAPGKQAQAKKEKGKGARFVSFRDEDGGFRFRLLAADGEELLLSQRFADPKEAGALMRRLQSEAPEALLQATAQGVAAVLDGVAVATAPAGAQGDAQAQLAKASEALASMSQE
jgi:tryptophanyl-tRNA synthetase